MGGAREEESSPAPARADEVSVASFLTDVPGAPGVMTVNAFLDGLRPRLEEMVRTELEHTSYAGRPCPWIPFLLGRYRNRPAIEVQRALRLYLRRAPPQSAEEALRALVDIGRRELRQWLESGGPPPPVPTVPLAAWSADGGAPSDAADVWRLGPGAPLPGDVRGRMERALGTDLSLVRVHAHDEAHALARSAHAHAFAVGQEVGFAANRFKPGTPSGDAMLAHELAHTAQHRAGARAERDGAAMERGADAAAVRALGALYPSLRTTGAVVSRGAAGLALSRCSSAPEVAPRDWRAENGEARDELARQIRAKHEEIVALMGHATLSDADFARMNSLYLEIDDLLTRLRALGYQSPDLVERVVSGTPGDRRIHILGLNGTAPLSWGERRQLEVDVDWVPPNTEIFVEWFVEGVDGEWPVANRGLPPRLTPLSPTGAFSLGEDMWLGPVGEQVLTGRTSQVRFSAKLRVGRDSSYEDTKTSDWIAVSVAVPPTLTIVSNGVMTPTASPGAPGASPAAADATPTVGTALSGAALEFRTSWVAPPRPLRGGSWTGYLSEWEVETPGHRSISGVLDPFTPLNLSPTDTGRYVVHARIRSATELSFGRVRVSRAPTLEASLAFNVVSSDELARQGLTTLRAQGVADYATTMRDLDAQISSVDATRSHGSPAMWQLDQQRIALGAMRSRLRDLLGDAPSPLPATGPLDPALTYVAPLPAVLAVPEARSAIPLRTFVKLAQDGGAWRASIVDGTTQDVVRFTATGADPASAVGAAVSDWQGRNEYPQHGTVRYELSVLGTSVAGGFTTSATRKTFWEWFDRIVFGLQALVAIALLVLPEPTMATKAAGIALLSVGVLRGVYRLYESLSLGRPLLDERHVLEALSIILSVVGLSGGGLMARAGATALSGEALGAEALTTFRVGRGLVMTAVAGDVGTFVWVAHSALAQMRAVAADGSLPRAERERRVEQMMMQLAGQGLLLIGMNAQLFRPGALGPRGTRSPAFVDAMGELQLDPVMRTRMEASLRRFGATDDLSTLPPRALLERYLELQRARAVVGDDIATRSSTRGLGVYEPAAAATQTVATVERAARPLLRAFGGEAMRLENLTSTATHVTAELVVEVPASGTSAAQAYTVRVAIQVVSTLTGGAHGADSGMARMRVAGDHASGFRLEIELDGRLATESDVRLNLSHELREGADLVRQLARDPTVDVEAQQRGGVFEPGSSTSVTSHARAAAFELRDLVTEVRGALTAWEQARTTAARARGAPVPDAVRQAGERAHRRLDAMLDAMGFADPSTRANKRATLLAELGVDERSPVAVFVDGYAERVTARVARQTELARLAPDTRTTLATGLGAELETHLSLRAPAAAIPPLAEAMARNLDGNVIRNLLREVVRQHRAGRLTDSALVEVLTALRDFAVRYREGLTEPTHAAALSRVVATETGPGILAELARLELRVVRTGFMGPRGTPAAPLPTENVRFFPEEELLGNGVHGIRWAEADARQRSVTQAAADAREGTPPPPLGYDQGRFGSLADVSYAVRCAASRLGPGRNNAAGLPNEGFFELPTGHGNVVLRMGVATPLTGAAGPDIIYVKVFENGRVHAYPGVRANMNLGVTGGVVYPALAVP